MKIIKLLSQAIKRDKSYLIAAVITICLILIMLSRQNWNNQPIVPVVKIEKQLPDFNNYSVVSEKKQAFFEYLRPFIREENNKIAYDRAYLERINTDFVKNSHHSAATLRKLTRLAKSYYVEIGDIETSINELKLRVDLIPESLVLVQAANESAWGTSRFAREANNLFGQWCYTRGCGLVPKGRVNGARHEVKRFDNPRASVVSYMRNLNSHYAYHQMREIRAHLRENGQKVTGRSLAQGLGSYSQRGESYIEELIAMIRQNNLE